MPESNSNLRISVILRATSKSGAIKAHADVRVEFSASSVEMFGLSVVQPHDPQKAVFVSYPQRPDKDNKKYFPIVRVTGALHEKIADAVLREWERTSAKVSGGASRAQLQRGPGDETPF